MGRRGRNHPRAVDGGTPNAYSADAKHIYPVSDAIMFENYASVKSSKESLLSEWGHMLRNAQYGEISVFRLGVEGTGRRNLKPNMPKLSQEKAEFALACYLIGAQPYSYFMYSCLTRNSPVITSTTWKKINSVWLALVAMVIATNSLTVAAESPNVVIVISDDQGYRDLECTGNSWGQKIRTNISAGEIQTCAGGC
ncbi:putative glycoside hydrolase [Novipirellula sp. SH528]|uniref:putative glycoside hydrolase n=1 Tax=Novipirellula sp. SH528 TaxID=3454466 RepID=UPI003F9EC35C